MAPKPQKQPTPCVVQESEGGEPRYRVISRCSSPKSGKVYEVGQEYAPDGVIEKFVKFGWVEVVICPPTQP